MGSLCLQALWCDCSVSSEVINTEMSTGTLFPLSLLYINSQAVKPFQHQTNKAKKIHPKFSDIPWKQQHCRIRSVRNSITVSEKANNHTSVASQSYHHLNLSTSPTSHFHSFSPSLSYWFVRYPDSLCLRVSTRQESAAQQMLQTVIKDSFSFIVFVVCFTLLSKLHKFFMFWHEDYEILNSFKCTFFPQAGLLLVHSTHGLLTPEWHLQPPSVRTSMPPTVLWNPKHHKPQQYLSIYNKAVLF